MILDRDKLSPTNPVLKPDISDESILKLDLRVLVSKKIAQQRYAEYHKIQYFLVKQERPEDLPQDEKTLVALIEERKKKRKEHKQKEKERCRPLRGLRRLGRKRRRQLKLLRNKRKRVPERISSEIVSKRVVQDLKREKELLFFYIFQYVLTC